MTTDLVRQKLQSTLATKSLNDLVRVRTSEKVFLLIDVSGSMDSRMRNGKRRIDGLREVVGGIKSDRDVKMIAFGDDGAYEVTTVPEPAGGTPLHRAIDLAKQKEAGHVVVISDGQPSDASACMESAKRFGGKIDVVFVGDPGERGEDFLRRLAASTGGTEFHGDLSEPKKLASSIKGLLAAPEDKD